MKKIIILSSFAILSACSTVPPREITPQVRAMMYDGIVHALPQPSHL